MEYEERIYFSQILSVYLSCHPLSVQHWAQEALDKCYKMNKLMNDEFEPSYSLARSPLGSTVSDCKTDSN